MTFPEPGMQTLPAGALQVVQLAAPSAEKEPKPQLSQVEAVVAPSTAENLPAKQLSHLEAPVICTHIYTNIHTYFYIHILCLVPHRRILCMIFVVAQTQTHSTHTLSTPAVAWYLPALASSRELQV